jgi:hypothetical protein
MPVAVIVLLFALANSPALMSRNIGMVLYTRFVLSDGVASRDLLRYAAWFLDNSVQLGSDRRLDLARLASAYDQLGKTVESRNLRTTALSGLTQVPCTGTEFDLVEHAARLRSDHSEVDLLQSGNWLVYTNGGSVGSVAYTFDETTMSCVAKVSIAFSPAGNRYLELTKPIMLEAGKHYRLHALTRGQGQVDGWLGLRKRWSGATLNLSPDWQPSSYDFSVQTSSEQDAISIVFVAGSGVLEVRNITVEKIQ